jgi:hypothetical protein
VAIQPFHVNPYKSNAIEEQKRFGESSYDAATNDKVLDAQICGGPHHAQGGPHLVRPETGTRIEKKRRKDKK